MKTSRQYIHQTLKIAEAKVSKNLLEVATSMGLQIKTLQPEKGILLGFNPLLDRKVIITYTAKYGVRTWYWYDNPEQVNDKKLLADAREYLLAEAGERGIPLSETEKRMHPSTLAKTIFGRLLSGEQL